jgi:N-acetylneuraminic acid mutarotase
LAIVSTDGTTPPVTPPVTPPNVPATTNTIRWTTGAKQLVARTEPETAVVGDKLYVFSGYGDKSTGGDGWAPSASYERYDPATNKWTKLGSMPIGTTHAAVSVVGTDIWFAGGYTARPGTNDKQDIASTNVWVYHTTTNKWDRGPSLPRRLASGGMQLINNVLYHISGEPQDHKSVVTDVYALDLANQSAGWKAKAPIPEGRTHFGIATVNNRIYIIGGQRDIDANATFLRTAYSYTPATNTWSKLADMPGVLSHLSPNTFALGTKIFSFGGEYVFNKDTNQTLQYDVTTNKFTKLTPMPGIRASGAAGFVGGKIVFSGGKNNGFFSDTFIGTFV